MGSIVNIRDNHVVMSGIDAGAKFIGERLECCSEFLRYVPEDMSNEDSIEKVIVRDNYNRYTVSDKLFAPRCWATKEEWEEFDRIINLDGVVWFYDKVNVDTKLYVADAH